MKTDDIFEMLLKKYSKEMKSFREEKLRIIVSGL